MRTRLSRVAAIAALLALGTGCQPEPIADDPITEVTPSASVDMELSEEEQTLMDTARTEGDVDVIVQVDTEDETEAVELLEQLKTELDDYGITPAREGRTWFSARVTEDALILLFESPKVKVFENGVMRHT
ncbi:hypothetical protein FB566_5015 [Stackebrandtia endophytica]|uniref:Uncharacterized protein n=1 Tax=Stackebrandtia endophytica TaxID=1496996 RepID=A0A543B3R7_9ACTN|nr:hypothetical protein [Stackebrandtia endophytica]TQL79410.1 hypothetical protein FB566_5015 [Stackebrandtia endophytica]